MKASNLARKLKLRGVTILSVLEGTRDLDGMVGITKLVYVNVPTYRNRPGVVAKSADGNEYKFYKERPQSDLDGLVADIRNACGFVSAQGENK